MIAALFVATGGAYFGLDGVDPWDETRDARKYSGPWPVVAHPPCERWGRYWSGGPSAKVRRVLGDDGGCFAAAIAAVRKWGGVLEHPEASHAFKRYGLTIPKKSGGWHVCELGFNSWTCCVEQGSYGHVARKATWLYYVGGDAPPELRWGRSSGARLDEGFHSKAERDAARVAGVAPIRRLSKAQNIETPPKFRDVLVAMARSVGAERTAQRSLVLP